MKVLVDANLSPDWVDWLRERGHESSHWYDIGARNAPDIEIMAYAGEHGWIVLTRDLDFGAILLQLEAVRPSVIQVRANPAEPFKVGAQVLAALLDQEAELVRGALMTVSAARTRARLLPFRLRDDASS